MEADIKTILYATDLGPRGPEVAIHAIHVTEPMSRLSNTLVERYLPGGRWRRCTGRRWTRHARNRETMSRRP